MKKVKKIGSVLVATTFMWAMFVTNQIHAEEYYYDDLNRLIKVVYDKENFVTYQYDNNGNLLNVQENRKRETDPVPEESSEDGDNGGGTGGGTSSGNNTGNSTENNPENNTENSNNHGTTTGSIVDPLVPGDALVPSDPSIMTNETTLRESEYSGRHLEPTSGAANETIEETIAAEEETLETETLETETPKTEESATGIVGWITRIFVGIARAIINLMEWLVNLFK